MSWIETLTSTQVVHLIAHVDDSFQTWSTEALLELF
jgi:hypothetical protein